jgi:uncharacterized LabA/DUF88 family protein
VSELPLVKKRRVAVLIDGFNLYHAIDDCPHFHGYKWLNPVALGSAYLMPSTEVLVATFFFTAVPPWNEKKRTTHERLLTIYEDLGVIVRRGMFKPTTAECRLCGKVYSTYEEKQTDINIALELLRMGRDDLADRIFLITGDNDQTASVGHFRDLYPAKEVVVVLPPYRKAKELSAVASKTCSLSAVQFNKSLLPEPYCFKKSARPNITKPEHWINGPQPPPTWHPRENWIHKSH